MANRQILIVEDDEALRDTLIEVLEEEGFEVSGVQNGKLALDYLRASPRPPLLILLDLMMPVMDGFEFRRRQLRDAKLAHVPVIVMSASVAADVVLPGLDFISKPLKIDRLLTAVQAHCG